MRRYKRISEKGNRATTVMRNLEATRALRHCACADVIDCYQKRTSATY
jgi:hypothetical protein